MVNPFSGQKAKGDVLRGLLTKMEATPVDVDYTQIELRLLLHAQQNVDRHYQLAFENWQRYSTKPESRWQFADRMAKQGEPLVTHSRDVMGTLTEGDR